MTNLLQLLSVEDAPLRVEPYEYEYCLPDFLTPGQVLEFYGHRKNGKLKYLHNLIASALLNKSITNQFQIRIIDYAHQFSTETLVTILQEKSDYSPEGIQQLLTRIEVINVHNVFAFKRLLTALSYKASEAGWKAFKDGRSRKTTFLIIMDIGSLLYCSGLYFEGLQLQNHIYDCLDSLKREGSLVIVLNHCQSDDYNNFKPTLGKKWAGLLKKRFYFDRDQQGYFYVPMMEDTVPQKYYYTE